MNQPVKHRLGVTEDPTALQPSLNDCLDAVLRQADALVRQVTTGLQQASNPNHPRRILGFDKGPLKQAIDTLVARQPQLATSFRDELTRLVYEGGGKEQAQSELLRFEDLKLFEDEELDQSIEVARALQEVSTSVDDVLPTLDALISTMLGWRTIQPGLNPIRPEVFVRALQHAMSVLLPESTTRERLIAPAAGLMGAHLRRMYREVADWLASTGVEAAVPLGGRLQQGGGAVGASVNESSAKTLLTLGKLRQLLSGEFDPPQQRPDFSHTLPASMALLQELKAVDTLVKRLEDRRRPGAEASEPVDMLAESDAPAASHQKIGLQLGEEVVRLMFDSLMQDRRLLPAFKVQLKAMEPAILRLAQEDSRFFSDRSHPARQLLNRLAQRSLAFAEESDEGWARFHRTVEAAAKWMDSKVIDAEMTGELLDMLQAQWLEQDRVLKQKREEAARALLHAEQRNLLAQKLAGEFAHTLQDKDVAEFVGDFLKGPWAQVVAEAKLSCEDGQQDPNGYRALVDDLVWSVQRSAAQRARARRLVEMIPTLVKRIREGLNGIGYPSELTARFFDNLLALHKDAVQEGRDPRVQAAAKAAWDTPSTATAATATQPAAMWLGEDEVRESGFVDLEDAPVTDAASPEAAETSTDTAEPSARGSELAMGSWVELRIKGQWLRAQLTWSSPHGTLFMFTSQAGTAHSMSRRTLEKLHAAGEIRLVADRNVLDEALDQVAQAALKNSLNSP